jgi:hypothetical protein
VAEADVHTQPLTQHIKLKAMSGTNLVTRNC